MNLLIIDNEKSQRDSLAGFLKKRGHALATVSAGEAGIAYVEKHQVDVVLTDFRMPDKSGMEVLEAIKALNPVVDVVLITAYGTIETAVEAMKKGAFDYLTKPIDLDELELLLAKIENHRNLVSENERLREQLAERYQLHNLIFQSREMAKVASTVARIAPTRTTVLISGESGTGKEVLAKAIHFASPRKDRSMVTVNCAALSDTLLESELFGHEKGSFTGADRQRIGRFEQAHNSTLFLDEVGDIPPATQVKLLRVLQERTIERVGSNQPLEVDVRVIAATHRSLDQMMKEGTFREDLYFRLNVVAIDIPPLSGRRDDIPLLMDRFLIRFGEENARGNMQFSKEAFDLLMKYDYPGNIRELENIVEQAVVLARGNVVTSAELPSTVRQLPLENKPVFSSLSGSFAEQVAAFEQGLIRQALAGTKGVQRRAADVLGMTERHLRYKLQKYGMKD
ncbi:acetoacetate metabolism regulatory protein AtoC [Desulfosarcina alkanivorans]|uniref:Acetoacetate metabolism regulatory protein AtoC n=1 Tax=Desulfosarcina alkanivorans TaxID=571177 RepID=A0A5K7YNG5_9BACT|nr:sigma-54 dependent transcriptional regulator [Desulfosarcina alkanivorans]BBO71312.1 acetoacetate metabolism regulatory protein AtoC [Desulfosarcina alkanivorans]